MTDVSHTDPARKALDIADLRAKAEAATPGEWAVIIDDDGNPLSGRPSVSCESLDCGIVHWDGFVQEYWRSARGDKEIHANAAHIAAFDPPTALALLDEIVSLRAALEAAEGKVGELETENYRLTRMEEARASRPDYEQLWAEEAEKREAAEGKARDLDEMLSELELAANEYNAAAGFEHARAEAATAELAEAKRLLADCRNTITADAESRFGLGPEHYDALLERIAAFLAKHSPPPETEGEYDGLVDALKDLLKQATTERSHYYVAKCCRDAITAIQSLQGRVRELDDKD